MHLPRLDRRAEKIGNAGELRELNAKDGIGNERILNVLYLIRPRGFPAPYVGEEYQR